MNIIRLSIVIALVFSLVNLNGCIPEEECNASVDLSRVNEEQLAADIETIDAYLSENNINAEVDDSGLRYVIDESGDGARPKLCDLVTVTYRGTLLANPDEFDSSEIARQFPLGNLITGWQIGIPKIKAGGTITLYIPSQLAYGSSGVDGLIPADANLIFKIDLFAVR